MLRGAGGIVFQELEESPHALTAELAVDETRHAKKPAACTSFFLAEPLPWMEASGENEKKIDCPRCHHRLGNLNWSGAQCSCEFFPCLASFPSSI